MDLFILVITCAINLLLGLFVVVRDIRKPYARAFGVMCLLTTVWITANFITNHHVDNLTVTNLANKTAFAAGYAVIISGLLFTYFFPKKRRAAFGERLFVGASTVVLLVLSFSDNIAGRATLNASGNLVFSIGDLLWLYIIGFIATVALIARNLLVVAHNEKPDVKRQTRYVLFAFIVSALLGLTLNVIMPLLSEDWTVTRFGPLATVFLVGMIAYTIIRHGLFDIRLAVVRGATYTLSLLTLAAVYYAVAFAVSRTIITSEFTYVDQGPFNVLLALLLAFIFQPVKRFFDNLTSHIFYRDNYSTDDFFARLSRELNQSTNLRELLTKAALEIGDTIKAEQSFFAVRYGANHHMSAGTERHSRVAPTEIEKIDEFVKTQGQTTILTDMLDAGDPLYRLLHKQKIALTLPLLQGDQIIGYLFLGSQRSRDYTRRDIRALETVSDELVIAIQNALSVQEVKEINATLQDRIKSATKELRRTNLQLQRLDAAKDEFVSMASHQLRTPLTSVKGYISMVLEGDVGRISNTQRQLLGEAFTSSERMVHLINDFLNVSRLQTGKFIVESRPIDLAKLVGQEVDSLKTTAGAHELQLGYRKPPYFPVLMIDEGKIRQVVMNFIDNAIYYSHEGTTIDVKLYIDGGDAVLEVHDTGIGVPKSEQAHLFGKFFRATNARRQRPDGTGVGLFLAKKVIDAHGGAIVFHSVEGQGSVFGFRLPIKRLRADDQAHELGQ